MSFIDSLKDKYKNWRKTRAEDKKYMRELKEEEKRLDEKSKEADGFLGIKYFIETIREDEEEKELLELLDDKEKEEFIAKKKEEKKMYITIATIFGVLLVFIVVGTLVLSEYIKTDLEKITKPLMEEYYFNKYGETIELIDIEYLTYRDKDNNEKNSDIQIATLDDKSNIVAVDDKMIGDNIDNEKIYSAYDAYLKVIDPSLELIATSPLLSYKDYYIDYNVFLSHIDALPNVYSFDDLIKSKKLTVTDIIMYQGDVNLNAFINFRDKLSDDSVLYLIKNNAGIPVNLTIIKKGNVTSIDILNTRKVTEDITYYNLDGTKNSVKSFEITSVKSALIENLDPKYKTINGYGITFDSHYNRDEDLATYFLVSLDQSLLDVDNLVMFSTSSYGSTYKELEVSDYPYTFMIKVGGSIYILGTEEVGIGNITENNDNFLCSIGLC